MKTITLLFCLLSFAFHCKAQSAHPTPDQRKLQYNVLLGIGRSTFETNLSEPSKFPTLEVRLGAVVVKPLSDVFEIRSGLTFGVKLKREDYNNSRKSIEPAFMRLNEVTSNRNHHFYEIPLLLQANLKRARISFRAGGNYRHFFPDNKAVDFLTARGELGVITGGSYQINRKVAVALNYFFGITKVYSSSGNIDSSPYFLNVRNQYGQITVEYRLGN